MIRALNAQVLSVFEKPANAKKLVIIRQMIVRK